MERNARHNAAIHLLRKSLKANLKKKKNRRENGEPERRPQTLSNLVCLHRKTLLRLQLLITYYQHYNLSFSKTKSPQLAFMYINERQFFFFYGENCFYFCFKNIYRLQKQQIPTYRIFFFNNEIKLFNRKFVFFFIYFFLLRS